MMIEDKKERLIDIYNKNQDIDEILSLCKDRLNDSLILYLDARDFEFDILDLMYILRKKKVNYDQESMIMDLENGITNDFFYEMYHPTFLNNEFNNEGFCANLEFEYELKEDEE